MHKVRYKVLKVPQEPKDHKVQQVLKVQSQELKDQQELKGDTELKVPKVLT